MMRRIAIIGSILIGLSALAAMGLAQSGQRSHSDSSLVDRLSALRDSVAPPESNVPTSVERSGERSVLTPLESVQERGRHHPAAGRKPDVPPQDRPRRPRLFSTLDPRNLLSLGGGDSEDRSRPTVAAPSRTRPHAEARAHARRTPAFHPAASERHPSALDPRATRQSAAPPLARPHHIRRSPLADRSDEELPSAEAAPSRPGPVALGPAASESSTPPETGGGGSNSSSTDSQADQQTTSNPPTVSAAAAGPRDRWRETAGAGPPPGASEEATPELSAAGAKSARQSPPAPPDDSPTGDPQQDRYAGAEPQGAEKVAEPLARASGEPDDEVPPLMAPADDATDESSAENTSSSDSTELTSQPPSDDDNPAHPAPTQVLSSDEAPAVAWDVRGPRQMIIGRESTFEVRLRNEGEHAAKRLIARIEVPRSAEIAGAEATQGVGQRVEDGRTGAVLEWRIDRLPALRESVLELRVVPRTSETVNLEVSVRPEPRTGTARVEVLEPKLQLALDGPTDVLFGQPRTYRITVSNPGTGPAENVVVQFTPPGQDESSVERHPVGVLQPGHSKTLEVRLTHQVPGDVAIGARASADGDLRDEAVRQVLVRRPELVASARGPRTTYAGTVATYYYRVQNTGNAVAHDVHVAARLPRGGEFIRSAEDRKLEPDVEKTAVNWKIGDLSPGEEFFIELQVLVKRPGENTLEMTTEVEQDALNTTKSLTTHVVALADLKLEVADPKGPVAVGKEAVYEVRVRNRGSNTAEQVNVVALFSEGIEPVRVEGGQHTIDNGRVAFRTIESLPAGRDIVFTIRAVASQAGTHVFRTEVLCRELETKLAAEETTRYYLDQTPELDGADEFRAAATSEEFELQ